MLHALRWLDTPFNMQNQGKIHVHLPRIANKTHVNIHATYMTLIPGYSHGALRGQQTANRHADECSACRQTYTQMNRTEFSGAWNAYVWLRLHMNK